MDTTKYDTDRIITNDIYLAAYLLSEGHRLCEVERNPRKRLSFVFIGSEVAALRTAYRRGRVYLNIRRFRDHLLHVRHLLDAHLGKRSDPHARAEHTAAQQ